MRQYLTNLFGDYCDWLKVAVEYRRCDRVLFLSRGGLRLQCLFQARFDFEAIEKLNVDSFYVSRLATIKAACYITPEIAAKDLAKEYYGLSLYDALNNFAGGSLFHDYFSTLAEESRTYLLETTINQANICDCLKNDFFLRLYVKRQWLLLNEYWHSLTTGYQKIALVDTGWSGTIVFYLKLLFPDTQFEAFFVGKSNYGKGNFAYHDYVHGMLFDTDKVISNQYYSYVIENRHLIEYICEPKHPSTEGYWYDKDEGKVVPDSGYILEEQLLGSQEDVFYYIYEHIATIQESKNDPYFRRMRAATLYPSRKDVANLSGISRSADFGKTLTVDLLLPRARRPRYKRINIRRALWKQGQIVLEFGYLGRVFLYFYYQVFPYLPMLRKWVR